MYIYAYRYAPHLHECVGCGNLCDLNSDARLLCVCGKFNTNIIGTQNQLST